MSQANASARKRRAFNDSAPNNVVNSNTPARTSVTNSPNNTNSSTINSPGLTLPQVISLIDRRLINLEGFVRETKDKTNVSVSGSTNVDTTTNTLTENITSTLNEIVSEFNHRFELLANEIDTMKDIVLKLQSFTMEVNKTLVEERVHVFSEMGLTSPTSQSNLKNESNNIIFTELDGSGSPTSVDLRNLVDQELSNQ